MPTSTISWRSRSAFWRRLGHLLDGLDLNERRTRLSFANADLDSSWAPRPAEVLDAAIQSWGKR